MCSSDLLALWRPWVFVFVVGVLLSIMAHEYGHYFTARRSGMKVTQFFLGFGPRVWSTHRNGIEYGIRAVPLGGFVKIIGMTNMDEVDPDDEGVTYRQASFPHRLWVITAGSVTHVIIALVTIVGVYAVSGRVQESGQVTVRSVSAKSPAETSGLLPGDVVHAAKLVEHLAGSDCFGALLQYPGVNGQVRDLRPLIDALHAKGALAIVAADLLALTLLASPGELGADIACGTTQRFGMPMGNGGPHAAYLATKDEFKRSLPGRLVGVKIGRAHV